MRQLALWLCFVSVVALLAAAAAAGTGKSQSSQDCVLPPGTTRTVVSVVDPETIVVDDGGEIKLAGLLAPRALDAGGVVSEWLPERAATAALSELVIGRTISVYADTQRRDRYGRQQAHVFVEQGGRQLWVQGRMLELGHARAHGIGDGFLCAAALRDHERLASTQNLGLWSNAAYRERAAYRTRELLKLRSTFQIVVGRVRKVAETKSAIHLNFGADWHADFTAGFRTGRPALSAPEFVERIKALEGRLVRVRGWIERRNGPYIEITHPLNIEPVGDGAPALATTAGSGGPPDRSARP